MKRDLFSGLIFIILGIALLTILVPMGIVEPRKVRFAALSPSYYPRIVAGALLLLRISAFLSALLTPINGISAAFCNTFRYHWMRARFSVFGFRHFDSPA